MCFLFQCYMFHMYVGVRAGGGIGDQIEDPAGDEYEIYRMIFDITFFFFVIVILLAIIQGELHLPCLEMRRIVRRLPKPCYYRFCVCLVTYKYLS